MLISEYQKLRINKIIHYYGREMNTSLVNINTAEMSKAVQALVHKRAMRFVTFIVYQENGKIIKDDPLTGHKTVVLSSKK